jgi:predicted nucleic acid-binding protein
VKRFFDTSVLVAVFYGGHPAHEAAIQCYRDATPRTAFCAAHSVAELYAVMTRLPVRPAIAPEQCMLFVNDVRERFTLVSLTGAEYVATVASAAKSGLPGGNVYDALILACAGKAAAEVVYTLHAKDFERIAPDLAGRIQSP